MVAAGYDSESELIDVEVIDLTSATPKTCFKPANLPADVVLGAGAFVNGAPIFCGRFKRCVRYKKETDIWETQPYVYSDMETARYLIGTKIDSETFLLHEGEALHYGLREV